MEAEIFTDEGRLDLSWRYDNKNIPENDEYFTITTNLTLNKTVLDIHNALASLQSFFFINAFGKQGGFAFNMFILKVRGKIIFTEYCIIHEFISAYVNVLYITKVLLSFLPIPLTTKNVSLLFYGMI